VGNPALLVSAFAADPFVSDSPWWAPAGGAWYDGAATVVWLPGGARITLLAPCSSALASPDDLVEAAFTIDSVVDVHDWRLTLASAVSADGRRVCRFFREPGAPAAAVEVAACVASASCNSQLGGPPVANVAAGDSYLLQSWGQRDPATGEQSHYCRLLSADGASELTRAELTNGVGVTPIDGAGTIEVLARRVLVRLDAVRAFQPGS